MTEVYLVRHGETEWSSTGRHTSTTDLALTGTGCQQAEDLGNLVRPGAFDLILSSPRVRALQTADKAGFTGDAGPSIDADLAEWNYGDYEGLTSDEITEQRPGWQLWTDGCPGGELPTEIVDRMRRLISRIRALQPQRAICFGHGHALRVLMLCWLGLEVERGEQFPLRAGALSVVGEAKGRPALLRWNLSP